MNRNLFMNHWKMGFFSIVPSSKCKTFYKVGACHFWCTFLYSSLCCPNASYVWKAIRCTWPFWMIDISFSKMEKMPHPMIPEQVAIHVARMFTWEIMESLLFYLLRVEECQDYGLVKLLTSAVGYVLLPWRANSIGSRRIGLFWTKKKAYTCFFFIMAEAQLGVSCCFLKGITWLAVEGCNLLKVIDTMLLCKIYWESTSKTGSGCQFC